jgi:chromosome segregation ATPase
MTDTERSLTEINKQITEITRSCNSATRQANQLSKALQIDPTNTKLLTANFQVMSRQIALTTTKIQLLKDKQDSLSKSGDTSSDQYQKLSVDIALASSSLEQLKKKQQEAMTAGVNSAESQSEAIKEIGNSANSLSTEVGAVSKSTSSAIESTKSKQEEMTKAVNKTAIAFTAMGAAAIAAIKGLYSLMEKAASVGSSIYSNVKKYGVDTEEYQQKANIWEKATDDASSYTNALSQMQEQIALAGKDTVQTEKALNKLGLTCKDISNLSVSDALSLISEKLMEIEDPTERANAAVQLLHNSGTDLATVLNTDVATINEWNEANSSNIISSDSLESAEQLNYDLENLQNKLKAIAVQLGNSLSPMLSVFTELLTNLSPIFEGISNFMSDIGETGQAIIAGLLIVIAQLPILAALIKIVNTVMNANPIFLIVSAVATLLTLIIQLFEILHKKVDENYTEMAAAANYASDTASKTAEVVSQNSTTTNSTTTSTDNSTTQNVTIENVNVSESASDTDSLIKSINVKALQNI